MRSVYQRWSEHPYPGELVPPQGSPGAGYQSMFFILRDRNNFFFDSFNQQDEGLKLGRQIGEIIVQSLLKRTLSII